MTKRKRINATNRRRNIEAEMRAQKAIELMIDGLSTAAIAKQLGVDPRTVLKLVTRRLHEMKAEGAEEMRKVLSARAHRAAATAAALLDDPDKRVRLEAARTLTRTIGVHARLFGLERKTLVIEPPTAPTEHDLTRLTPDEVWTLRELQQKATPGALPLPSQEAARRVLEQAAAEGDADARHMLAYSKPEPPKLPAPEPQTAESVDVEIDDL